MSKKRRSAKKSGSRSTRKRAAAPPARGRLKVATNKRATTKQRVAAMVDLPIGSVDSAGNLESVLEILGDRDEPIQVRLTALQTLGAARFASAAFPSIEGDYVATLRQLADDPDPELRQRVLGILAREKDGFVQKKLLDGLRDPAKALVAPEKALQLLGYDPHADAYSVARQIVSNPPNALAKREALRLLAADAGSAPTFETILRNKTETPEIRQISAAALHALNPGSLQSHAREIVLDPTEPDDMRETSLTALRQFGAPALADDKPLMDRVEQLSTSSGSKVQHSARQFLSRYKR